MRKTTKLALTFAAAVTILAALAEVAAGPALANYRRLLCMAAATRDVPLG